MFRKILVTAALAAMCTFGAAGVASAEQATQAEPPVPMWIAVYYFGPQSYCLQAGAVAQATGQLPAGGWMCDSGWLMVAAPMTP
jgi:hypothetical protein